MIPSRRMSLIVLAVKSRVLCGERVCVKQQPGIVRSRTISLAKRRKA